ncbi:hypothetical protein AVDCRST_MAG94-5298 [uncultured Leptolyngbya sp.]|uniref:Uncharacterized protein n=1 Tax=uncultured Leptolyngbya sp. TaxID=332963 RepID=A0A6J4NQR9_9CYAN|nr:hypothetical protein AVDCRST_MAG94-5298 [uncultured Leptolyngbya sp.]
MVLFAPSLSAQRSPRLILLMRSLTAVLHQAGESLKETRGINPR